MVFRKKSKIDKIQDRITKLENLETKYLGLAEKYANEDHPSKGRDATMTAGICRTKIIELNKIIEELKATEQSGGDRTVEWSNITAELFLKWLKNTDPGYYYFLNNIMLGKNTEIKDVMERFDDNRQPTHKKVEMINEAERLIVEQYCKKYNLILQKKERDTDEQKKDE